MNNTKIEAPWYTYQKKIKALFDCDPEITVGEIKEKSDGYEFTIEVLNNAKMKALKSKIPAEKVFGNVILKTFFKLKTETSIFKVIFTGNPLVADIKDIVDPTGTHHEYICFKPEILQFLDDDLRDYVGNWTGIPQDIAREIFEEDVSGTNFCTMDKREM